MPSLITHYLCGEKALLQFKNKTVRNIIEKNRQIFNLGTQGPDIYFFHDVHLSPIYEVGELMHHKKVGEFFLHALKYISGQSGYAKEILTAYILGFACHYALDTTAHPYVYYKVGFLRKDEFKTFKYNLYHHRFEKALDILMLENEHKVNPCDIKIQNLIKVKKPEALIVGQMYKNVLHQVYHIEIKSEDVYKGAANMAWVFSHLRDRAGIKKKLVSPLRGRFLWAGLVYNYLYPRKLSGSLDYLNLKHTPWCLPWDSTKVYTNSFNDMFNLAAKETVELFKCIYPSLFEELSIESAVLRIGNRSFSTGLDCNLNLEFKYFDCIFE